MKNRIVSLLCTVVLFSACASVKQISYLQDTESDYQPIRTENLALRLLPNDEVSIIVTCKDPTLTSLFNKPYISQMIGSNTAASGSASRISGYVIDSEGFVDFPVAGKIKVAGHTREEVSEIIKNVLQDRNLVKDPIVSVDFINLGVAVLGEVAHPGRFAISKDDLTILDVLAMAGDLTINGKRENVKLVRAENGERKVYLPNLTKAEALFRPPAFYVCQNDLVYVEPNRMRARQSMVNGNNLLNASFWISIASLATTITTMVATLAARSR